MRHLQEEKEYSLVLLDEPEVSIHPGAYGMTLDAFPDAGRNGKRMD